MSTDLLDFLSMPSTTAKSAPPHAAAAMQQASSSTPAAAAAAAQAPFVAPTSPLSDFGESFDLTSGALEAELAAEGDREHAFSGAPGDDDLWNSLQEEWGGSGTNGAAGSMAGSQSVSQSLGLEPSSSLYAASKRLDSLGTRMNDAAGRAIDSINAFDRRHGVSAALRQTDAKYAVSGRLEGMQSKLTAGADRISHDIKEKVHKAKEARARSRSNSISGSGSQMNGANGHRSAGSSELPSSKSGSRRGSAQFISFTEADRIPPPPSHQHSHSHSHLRPPASAHSAAGADSDDEPNPSPTVVAATSLPPVAMPVAMPATSAAGAATGARTHVSRSSFSYEPQAFRTPPIAASSSSVSKTNVISPPAALFELGSSLSDSSDEDDDSDDASAVDSPPHTPTSSTVRSRSNSLSFTSLNLNNVDLSGGADGPLSPDGPSPQARGGLLGR